MTLVESVARVIDPRPFTRAAPVTDHQSVTDMRRRNIALNKARRIIAILPEAAQRTYSAETVEAVCARVEEIATLIEEGRSNGQ